MATIDIDGKQYDVKGGDNLLQTVLSLGLDLPYFCWHPAMGSVGACRQCAVIQYRDENDDQGRITMACMAPVTDGMRISVDTETAQEFRAGILELLMTNHPHDCPVCEEGGECHLQDMTVMTGQTFRKYRGKKRTHRNQYLGPFISHEMNRCIACYRCVRYYQNYAGGDDLQVFASHNNVYFGRHEEGVLENEFSGNLVEVCPTGVFTDKTLSQCYSRKWDIQAAPSICAHCSLGCNTSVGERYGQVRRIVNRYNGDVNGYFLCDRGRFGYGFVNSEKRIRKPLIQNQQVINKEAAVQHFQSLLSTNAKVIGIGSPRASIEANFALREAVGAENFYLGFDEKEHELIKLIVDLLKNARARISTLRQVEDADAALVLGEDVTNTAPLLALALRQAVRNRSFDIADDLHIPRWQDDAVRDAAQQEKSPLFIASVSATRLDDVATGCYYGNPEDIARLGFAIAHEIDNSAPAVNDLTDGEREQARTISKTLQDAKQPLVVSGSGSHSRAVLEAAANIAKALSQQDKTLSLVVPECNSIGLSLIGGESFHNALNRLALGNADTVVILENDLYRRGDRNTIDRFLSSAKHVVAIDHLRHETTEKAELVLPASTFAETEGTFVSAEGRAQRFFSVVVPRDDIQDSWRWFKDVGSLESLDHTDDLTEACCSAISELQPIKDAAPDAGFRMKGLKIPRQPHRYSGRTAMLADINVSEPKQPEDTDSALSFSMEGVADNCPPALNPGVWAPAWNSNQSLHKFQDEIGGHLKGGDPGIRLFDSTSGGNWFNKIPEKTNPKEREFVSVPIHHIFGGEELSVFSPPLAERVPEPYVAMNKEQATAMSLANNDEVEISQADNTCQVKVKGFDEFSKGVIGIPQGLPGVPRMELGTTITIRKVKS